MQEYDSVKRGAIVHLKKLKPKLHKEKSARIEFASTVYEFGLYDAVICHDLMDRYNISQRDLDCCFEMNDGGDVVIAVMERAVDNKAMELNIRASGSWDQWITTYNSRACQLSLV
ncbi:hypothetical protein A3715_10320 [Oleiphilus sp. HI0009]|nr:hypothetical protein A3715_10320 [Oleiphilus sp. HI0009]